MRCVILAWATGLGFGYFPKIPGSIGTLWGILLFYFLQPLPRLSYGVTIVVFTLVSVWISTIAENLLARKDDPRIVIDEVVGFLFATLGFSFHGPWIIGVYILFRFFDIVKIFPVNWMQNHLPAGWGIVMDDVMAGIYACAVLHGLRYLWGIVV
ncbi:MAG: hypothetical protein A3F89_05870 [Deltaproteobacteria bacterium RIFCSPLOWO2_12_FULL_50_11]|nr:MAG: hypothetical protein A3B79_00810 [Deltaproteobacteria bacterium RIFCSPHIGHO2_02_FULL_50_15]OGQ66603.1 MAG: hypothetical protein A3F89_05870 [Deltaproteobacteria bacterium RIFCSPLOWO2_12_FULL_50_11]